jgi:hypothetical protein
MAWKAVTQLVVRLIRPEAVICGPPSSTLLFGNCPKADTIIALGPSRNWSNSILYTGSSEHNQQDYGLCKLHQPHVTTSIADNDIVV